MQAPVTIGMPIDKMQFLPKWQQAKFVVYYTRQAGFEILRDAFLAQWQNILNKHSERSNTVCIIMQSSNLQRVHNIIEQDTRFNTYVSAYAQARIEIEVKKLSLNPCLKM